MLTHGLGRYAAVEMVSPHDHPLFDMSAVDGYAFRAGATSEWKIAGEVAAGDVFDRALDPGECVRIFTGAMIPEGADTVVMQEHAQRVGGNMRHTDPGIRPGANVRKRAEQFHRGERVMERGVVLDPPAIGLLASVGVDEIEVARRPRVAVIVTGGEFHSKDDPHPGRIFNSNDVMLAAALQRDGIDPVAGRSADQRVEIGLAISRAMERADVIITTGGASVGDHDLVALVLQDMGARIRFHGVAQKPGKPMLFAEVQGKTVFGLPGNPRAVMVLFGEYVLPFLRAMQGARDSWPRSDRLLLSHPVEVKGERAEFRAAQARNGSVTLLKDEGSHMLRSLSDANALAYLHADQRRWNAGEVVEVHYLPR